ncbi:hypothetical protein RJT34_33526 [Clitoria ternatea]|uniref:Protein kinase domain-containing protein n=1 Tax=Clitoria ternatea TaxID=43366 RepID=A0AAN9IAI6_CLITE
MLVLQTVKVDMTCSNGTFTRADLVGNKKLGLLVLAFNVIQVFDKIPYKVLLKLVLIKTTPSCLMNHGVLKSGQAAAIKELDASKQADEEFLAQVSMFSRLKHDNFVQLLGYCVDGSSQVLAYEFASNGSVHDILHGRKGVKGAQPGPVQTSSTLATLDVGKLVEVSSDADGFGGTWFSATVARRKKLGVALKLFDKMSK